MSNLLKLLQPIGYKSKIKLCCSLCIADFPQKVKKQQENRPKIIIITENNN